MYTLSVGGAEVEQGKLHICLLNTETIKMNYLSQMLRNAKKIIF